MPALHFTEQGEGRAILLIHGFPLNGDVWTEFAAKLSSTGKVFTVDLPGLGKSESIKTPFSIDQIATELLSAIKEKGIERPVIIGHSLGGYVALAMAEAEPKALGGLVLFHSTAYADSEEKRDNRNKVVDFVQKNGVLTFTSNFIPPLFADPQHPAIEKVRAISVTASYEAVVNYTIAMRDRPDRTSVLKEFYNPILFIAGEKDSGIPVETIKRQASLNEKIELCILADCAHMGMFEKPEECRLAIQNFVNGKVTDN